MIRAHGSLPVAYLGKHCANDAFAMLSALETSARAMRITLAPDAPELLIATEDAHLFAAAYPGANISCQGSDTAIPDAGSAQLEIVRRVLATFGPITAQQLSVRLVIPRRAIEAALMALEARGTIFRGRFLPPANPDAAVFDGTGEEQWCDRYVLERIHRQTLNRLRAEVEPCTDHEFAAFRLRWQHLGAAPLEPGAESVRIVLQQLSGLAFSPEFWEQAIFSARIRDYRPEHLDLLCMSGEFAWVAAPIDEVPGASADFPTRVASSRAAAARTCVRHRRCPTVATFRYSPVCASMGLSISISFLSAPGFLSAIPLPRYGGLPLVV
jgi:ATP-dependent Lhr-like helicase